ncbi:hypothetical protein [Vibrio sp. TRT 17S01]|uniref:hypothetical protein n=1 Tax=Vibrio sp. TRT 17S01 TaxID=3418505 RepID=UPI003CF2C44E
MSGLIAVLKSLPLVSRLVLKASDMWERHQRAKQLQQQEQKYNAIKQDAKAKHTERFGASSGRVRIDVESNSDGDV